MKKIFLHLFPVLLVFCALSCAEKPYTPGKIDLDFQFSELEINLNLAESPYILCVVNAEQPLASVSMFLLRKNGVEEPYKSPITEFYKAMLCTVHERPVYDEEMTGFKVVARDKGGAEVSGIVQLNVIPVATAPVTVFSTESLNFAEGDPIPPFGFTVTADSPLVRVNVDLISSGTLMELVPPIEQFENPKQFFFHSSEYTLPAYDINKIPSGIRVTAEDSYGKKSFSVLKINYKALPAPELSVNPVAAVDEFSSCSVSGNAKSETGITEVSVYTVGEKYECLVSMQEFASPENCDFTLNIDGNEIRDYVTTLKVVAKDARSKTAEQMVPLEVRPKLWKVEAGENLLTVIRNQEADAKFRSIKLELAAGAEFDLGSASYTLTKSLILEGAAGERPTVRSSASYTFLTDNAVIDTVRLQHIHFTSTKNGAGMFNNAGGCSISGFVIRDCRFDGSYAGALLRTAGNCILGEVRVEDCIFRWANTSGGSAFFHTTQASDKVARLSLTGCTLEGIFYLWFCNIGSSTIEAKVSHNTFVNQKGSTNGYFISFGQGSLKGSLLLRENLFGGSNNIKGGYRMLRANSVTATTEENWCTPSWKTFTDDGTNGSVNFVSILPATEDNNDIFTDLPAFDLTLRYGTSVREKGIGDPRWLK